MRSAPEGAGVKAGDRVAAFCMLGGFAEVAVAPAFLTFALPDRARLRPGRRADPQLPHGLLRARAARPPDGGRDRARARRRGRRRDRGDPGRQGARRRTIAVVSSDEKARVAREAGADEVVRSDGAWKDEAKELSGGGVDVVLDPVGGDRFTDSLRSLGEGGRVVVVGFTGGSIPEVSVNRLLLNNVEVVGAGWGAYALGKPDVNREVGDGLLPARRGGLRRPDRRRALPARAARARR